MKLDPQSRPRLRLIELIKILDQFHVDWIMTGSTVLALYGLEIAPNDLDVTPSLDPDNLCRLSEVLEEIHAVPAYFPMSKHPITIEECLSWRPIPPTEENLELLYVTDLGMLDLPMRMCGTYEELLEGSSAITVRDIKVNVCNPEEVLIRLGHRKKDRDRESLYNSFRTKLAHEEVTLHIEEFLQRMRV